MVDDLGADLYSSLDTEQGKGYADCMSNTANSAASIKSDRLARLTREAVAATVRAQLRAAKVTK